MMVNSTLQKFGYPETLIAEYDHWCVLLRPAQATLGALVLAAKSDAEAFHDLPEADFLQLHRVIGDIETTLMGFRPYKKINYLMLMMVDPHVHFHVVPRYDKVQTFNGVDFADPGWPKLPDLGHAVTADEALAPALVAALKDAWPL